MQIFLETEVPEIKKSISFVDLINTSQYKFDKDFNSETNKQLDDYTLPDNDDEILSALTNPVDWGEVDQEDYILSVSNIVDLENIFFDEPFINETLILAQMKTVSTDRASEIADMVKLKIDSMIENEKVKLEATGLLVFLKDFVSMVVNSSVISILTSVFAIFIIILAFFKRLIWALLSVILCYQR